MRRHILYIVLIAALGFVVYGNSLKGEFVWDDYSLIKDNVFIKDISFLPKFFTESIGQGAGRGGNFFRPLQMISYMLDYSVWRLNPFGFHLTNTILHILVAVLIYFLLLRLSENISLSLLASLLFVVHPIHTEAVAYISGRADSLAALFMLLAFIFYLEQLDSERGWQYPVILIAFTLGLCSRENILVFPLVILFYHHVFKRRIELKTFLSLVVIDAGYIALRLTLLRSILFYEPPQGSFFARIPGFFAALTTYLRLLVVPLGLHMEYGDRLFPWTDPRVLIGVLLVVAALAYFFIKKKKEPLLSFSLGWFFIWLLPHSNLYPIGPYMAEHWLYLPSLGFFVGLASLYLYSLKARKLRPLIIGGFIAILGFYSVVTLKQNAYWKEATTFYERTLHYYPYSARLYNNLGTIYRLKGRNQEAIEAYRKAIALDPDYSDAFNNLGIAYFFVGETDKAVESFQKALSINPDFVEAYGNLGNVYRSKKDFKKAVEYYKKSIAINPFYAKAYYNLGNTSIDLGKKNEAFAYFRKAVALDPDYPEALTNLGNLYKERGDLQQAIVLYKRAIKVNPRHATAHNNLAIIYFELGRSDLAIEHCDAAVALGYPVSPKLLEMLKPYRKE